MRIFLTLTTSHQAGIVPAFWGYPRSPEASTLSLYHLLVPGTVRGDIHAFYPQFTSIVGVGVIATISPEAGLVLLELKPLPKSAKRAEPHGEEKKRTGAKAGASSSLSLHSSVHRCEKKMHLNWTKVHKSQCNKLDLLVKSLLGEKRVMRNDFSTNSVPSLPSFIPHVFIKFPLCANEYSRCQG